MAVAQLISSPSPRAFFDHVVVVECSRRPQLAPDADLAAVPVDAGTTTAPRTDQRPRVQRRSSETRPSSRFRSAGRRRTAGAPRRSRTSRRRRPVNPAPGTRPRRRQRTAAEHQQHELAGEHFSPDEHDTRDQPQHCGPHGTILPESAASCDQTVTKSMSCSTAPISGSPGPGSCSRRPARAARRRRAHPAQAAQTPVFQSVPAGSAATPGCRRRRASPPPDVDEGWPVTSTCGPTTCWAARSPSCPRRGGRPDPGRGAAGRGRIRPRPRRGRPSRAWARRRRPRPAGRGPAALHHSASCSPSTQMRAARASGRCGRRP